MNKTTKVASVSVLLLMLLVLGVGQVFAYYVPPANAGFSDPVVTPQKITDTYTKDVVGVGYLKGAVQNENQLMAPIGRTDEQFGSNGLVISDLTGKEKVNACFEFSGYNYKWSGNIYKWNGTKWVKQTTTFTNDPAGTPTACASGLGNGTYALIIYYWGPQENSAPVEEHAT